MPSAEESHGVVCMLLTKNKEVLTKLLTTSVGSPRSAGRSLPAHSDLSSRADERSRFSEISHGFQTAGVRLDHETLQDMIRFLLLTFRSAGRSNLSADNLVSKLEEGSNKWLKASLQVLHRLWSEHGSFVHAQQEIQTMLSISQLVDVQWKLGMAVSSDTCRSLNSPYVTLLLKIAEPSGQICQRSFEMTIPQFQNFHKQFKEMAAIMETV